MREPAHVHYWCYVCFEIIVYLFVNLFIYLFVYFLCVGCGQSVDLGCIVAMSIRKLSEWRGKCSHLHFVWASSTFDQAKDRGKARTGEWGELHAAEALQWLIHGSLSWFPSVQSFSISVLLLSTSNVQIIFSDWLLVHMMSVFLDENIVGRKVLLALQFERELGYITFFPNNFYYSLGTLEIRGVVIKALRQCVPWQRVPKTLAPRQSF